MRLGGVLLAVLMAGCSKLPTASQGVAYLEVYSPATLSLSIGSSLQFSARALDRDRVPLADVVIRWRTPDGTIRVDDTTGLVTGVKAGSGRVHAFVGDNELVSDYVTVTVTAPSPGSAPK